MNKKDLMFKFIKTIENNNVLTDFIINIFDYDNFHDYNYIFRLSDEEDNIIIDIYDNISDNRFNRYLFSFKNNNYDIKKSSEGNVFVTKISVNNLGDSDNKLYKLAYLFSDKCYDMITYSSSFLNSIFIEILKYIIK